MKKSLLPFASLLCAAVLCAVSLLGDVPRTISYQGYLADADGVPIEGPVAMTFRLYGQLAEGVEVWAEYHETVALTEGRFVAVLGSVTALPADFSQPLYLEIQVGAEVLSPRLPLRSVPYALQAAKVDAGGVDAAAVRDGAIGKAKLGRDLAGAGLVQNSDGGLRIAGGGVVGTMIAEGAIANGHIAANAGIEPGKVAGTAVTLGGIETLTNKTLERPVVNVLDSDFTIVSATMPTNSARLQLGAGRTGVFQTLILPGGDGTLALESYVNTQIAALADVASSGSFADLGEVPPFARLDQPNIFTASSLALSIAPAMPYTDAVLFQILPAQPIRPETGGPVFSVDAEGDVVAASFAGSGAFLTSLDAAALATGTVSLDRLPLLPAAKVDGLATVATSGSFANLADVPAFARLDQANIFTAASLPISLEPTELLGDDILFRIMPPPFAGRPEEAPLPVFSVSGYGVVTAASFVGDGSQLGELNADNVASGTLAAERLPVVPAAKLALAEVAGPGLFHDVANQRLGVAVGAGLAIDGGKLTPSLDGKTIGTDGEGKLTVTGVVNVPVVVDTNEPTTPQHGALIFKDGALQVFNDPEGTGGTWIRIGTYQ